jgi:hypothetical protein
VYDGPPLTTVSQLGLLLSVHEMKTLQRHQLFVFSAESRGLPNQSRRLAIEGYHPCFPCEGFYPFEAKPRATLRGWLTGCASAWLAINRGIQGLAFKTHPELKLRVSLALHNGVALNPWASARQSW